jgi:2-oxoglutarate dehydrogenase E2 component (dihydrolipoamide succinyltransferase)
MDTSKSGVVSDATPVAVSDTSVVEESPKVATGPVEKIEVEVPVMGESITTGMMSAWNVAVGDYVEIDQVVAMIETDKVTVDVRSPANGTITTIHSGEGDEVDVGKPLFSMETGGVAPVKATTQAAPVAATKVETAAPVKSAAKAPAAKAHEASTPTVSGDRSETRVKMSRMRQRISQRLKDSQNTSAMLTTFQEVDMGYLTDLRKLHKEEFEKVHGVKLGFMSAFVKAATAALQEIPAVNGVIDDATNEIVYRNYVDISVAVASPTGLVVPVLRNCEKMSFSDVEKTIGAYGAKAKKGEMTLEDMTGGTFTISNGGVFGSLMGTPIINPPQSAILGMHATKIRAVVNAKGDVVARPMMYIALTYDHRLIDGREAVTFLKSIQKKIEDPHRLLLSI